MRAETFIAHRLYFESATRQRTSRPAIRVALAGIIIGVAVMVITLCVVIGFKRTITQQVAFFGAHIQLTNFDNNSTYELQPIVVTDSLVRALQRIPSVERAQPFLTKPGIIKTADQFQGIILKAADSWQSFEPYLLEGHLPESEQQVLLSRTLSRQLCLATGDDVFCYFVGETVRVRKWQVAGIYATGFEEADSRFVLATPKAIRRLNGWRDNQASGIEIYLSDLARLDEAADQVWYMTANRLDEDGNALYSQTLEQLNPQIFAWLDLLDMNVAVILLLMMAVSGFNIVSGLIILILESVRLIGTLKALGANNRFVRRIFITEAVMLIGKGMGWGNIVGLGLAAVQNFTHLIPLDASTYYVSYVPVAFPWGAIVLLNAGVLLVSFLILLAPSGIATRISPARVMRYE